MIKLTLLWTLCLFLLPVLLVQGIYTRLTARRLLEASGDNKSLKKEDVHILGLGDSVIAGVGIDELGKGLTAQVAASISIKNEKAVSWLAHGTNGDRVQDLITRIKLLPAERPSLVLISIGVNDVSHLTSLTRWQLEVANLIADLKEKYRAPILFIGLPPMDKFTALPQPLRFTLGVRAAMLDHTFRRASELIDDVHWIKIAIDNSDIDLANDGYHPSEKACLRLASEIALYLDGKIKI
ncbi:MAG: lysophospholipase L1-like esterase [Candidatus Azotimanducaceae bacterium]